MNGISFIPVGEVSEEAKAKLKKMMADRDKRLKQLKEDFDNDKLNIPGINKKKL